MNVDLSVDLHAAIGELAQEVKKDRLARERARALTPFTIKLGTGAVSPASGAFLLNFGGPDPGFYWMVRRVIIGGTNWSAVVAGTAELYVTGFNQPSGTSVGGLLNTRDVVDMFDQFAALPAKASYSADEVVVGANMNLAVVVGTPTASSFYGASAHVQVFRSEAAMVEFLG